MEATRARRDLSHLAGLIVIAVALAVAIPLAALIATDGVKDIKGARYTIIVTGSAKYPIAANLATWHVGTWSQAFTSPAAIKGLREKVTQILSFLLRGGLPADAITEPPINVSHVLVSVRTGLKKPAFRQVPAWYVSQGFSIQTTQIDLLQLIASKVGDLLAAGTDVSVSRIQYLSTQLTAAKFAALRLAVADARMRALTIAQGLGASLGGVQKTELGVYQITPRNSTAVSGYGIDDTSSRLKDVEAVVTVTFRVAN